MTKQEHATHAILDLTLSILKYGRPRKRPGKPRARATFTNGFAGTEPCNPRADYAEQYSLDGAVIAAGYFYRKEIPAATRSRAQKVAANAILEALAYYGANYKTLEEADNGIEDTRLVTRAVKRAEKQWRKITA